MKKLALVIALSLLCVNAASAATATTPAAPAQSAQQNKMKTCAAQYHQKGIAKSQYHAFMSQCLKSGKTASTTKAPAKAVPASAPAAAPVAAVSDQQ